MELKKAEEKIERPVLVTTEYRGVFFGCAEDTSGETIILKKARNCIYWAASVGGFLGLAATGPNKDCRIGAEVEQFEARKVTSVTEVSAGAAEKWRDAPCYKN
jgi:hypothetical protein